MLSFFKNKDLSINVDTTYCIIVDQSRNPSFYKELLVPDNIDGRFDVLTLHMFFIFSRLKKEEQKAVHFSQRLFDTMFVDMDQSLREMGVGDLSVGKRVKDMGKALLGRVEVYDRVFEGADSEIEASIVRNIYRGDQTLLREVRKLIDYSKRSILELSAAPTDNILRANFKFTEKILS